MHMIRYEYMRIGMSGYNIIYSLFVFQAVSPDGPKLKFHTEQYEI